MRASSIQSAYKREEGARTATVIPADLRVGRQEHLVTCAAVFPTGVLCVPRKGERNDEGLRKLWGRIGRAEFRAKCLDCEGDFERRGG